MYRNDPLNESEDRQVLANRFMQQSVIGACAAVIVVASQLVSPISEAPRGFRIAVGLAVLALIHALITMYRTRTADEYLKRLWSAGTSAAFIAAMAVALAIVIFGLGLALISRDPLQLAWLDHDILDPLNISLIAFFATIIAKRMRGD